MPTINTERDFCNVFADFQSLEWEANAIVGAICVDAEVSLCYYYSEDDSPYLTGWTITDVYLRWGIDDCSQVNPVKYCDLDPDFQRILMQAVQHAMNKNNWERITQDEVSQEIADDDEAAADDAADWKMRVQREG